MNAGMYGVPDGRGMAGRRLAFSSRKTTVHGGDPALMVNNSHAAPTVSTPALAAGVRTLIFSVQGRGAIRAAGVSAKDAAGNLTCELWLDGVRVVNHTATAFANAGALLAGFYIPTTTQVVGFDWMPFDTSAEIYATQTGANTGVTYAVAYDLYQ
jgi:hypothetical protein